MPEITLKSAPLEDRGQIMEIIETLPKYFLPGYWPEIENDVRNQINISAYSDNDIIGFINYKIHSPDLAEILWMAVSPNFQDKGIGSILMNEFLKQMEDKKIKAIELATIASTDNFELYKGTRRFYEKYGFKEIKIDKDYYGPGEDRGIMRLELKN
ncbi:MAG: GNAT family N-acetyltransferase [Candidatus Tagabacteria bacterium]